MFHKSIDTFININTSVIKPSLYRLYKSYRFLTCVAAVFLWGRTRKDRAAIDRIDFIDGRFYI